MTRRLNPSLIIPVRRLGSSIYSAGKRTMTDISKRMEMFLNSTSLRIMAILFEKIYLPLRKMDGVGLALSAIPRYLNGRYFLKILSIHTILTRLFLDGVWGLTRTYFRYGTLVKPGNGNLILLVMKTQK